MARAKSKPHPGKDALAAGIDAMATLVKKKSRAAGYRLRGAAKKLSRGQVLVVIADKENVVVRAFEKPPGFESAPRGAWENAAIRLAEMDAVVAEVVAQYPSLAPAEPEAALAESERKILHSGAFDLRAIDPREDPLARAAVEYARFLQASLSVEGAARRLRVNRSRIRQRLTGRPPTLYGVKKGREWRIPDFQFSAGGLVPGIDAVIARLPRNLHPLAVHRWFTSLNPDLRPEVESDACLTPRDWLRLGHDPDVVAEIASEL